MKYLLVVLLGFIGADFALAAAADNSKNTYACQIWEPNREGVDVRVDPLNQVQVHALQDGLHEVEIHWWHWTLNVSVRKKGEIPELLGAASHTNLKLRSHAPDVSVWCDKIPGQEILRSLDKPAKSCQLECQVWYPMPRGCREVCG
jgi:hypothetical protein